jgi:hypothetical protein
MSTYTDELQSMGAKVVEAKTLRDEFAMAALTGLLANNPVRTDLDYPKLAYWFADGMTEARK